MNQAYTYLLCAISRTCHAISCIVHKKALLREAAFDRYKTFKLSVKKFIKFTLIIAFQDNKSH